MAVDVLSIALPAWSACHSSQQRNPHAWTVRSLRRPPFRECGERGMTLSMVNLGGGFSPH